MPAEELKCERRSSICYKIGDIFRKYYKYAEYSEVDREGYFSRIYEDIAADTPHYIGNGFCERKKMFYSDFDYVEMEGVDLRKHFKQIIRLLKKTEASPCTANEDEVRWFGMYISGLTLSVEYLDGLYKIDISAIIERIISERRETFMHGDFTPDNVGIEKKTGRVMVYDFQMAGVGIRNWDYAYFLAAVPFTYLAGMSFDSRTTDLIRLISAVRYGRGVRKQIEMEARAENFKFWWGL